MSFFVLIDSDQDIPTLENSLRDYVMSHDKRNRVYTVGDSYAVELRADEYETDSILSLYFFERFCAEHPGAHRFDVGVVAHDGSDVSELAERARRQFVQINVDVGNVEYQTA